MNLITGSRFGSFEIVSPLGARGMGEVYRATDTRLKRQVALKVLPQSVLFNAGSTDTGTSLVTVVINWQAALKPAVDRP